MRFNSLRYLVALSVSCMKLVGLKMAAYVTRLCDGAAIAFRQLNFVLKLNRITEVEPMFVSRTIAKPIVGCRFSSPQTTSSAFLLSLSSNVSMMSFELCTSAMSVKLPMLKTNGLSDLRST